MGGLLKAVEQTVQMVLRAQNLQEAPLTGKLVLFQREQLPRTVFCAKAQIQLGGKHVAPIH